MVESFPRTLSLLRKEKKISQKEAAASLGVSQALLSHYENGLREPGLEFAVNAAKYYGVSTDYLLGITMEKNGSVISAEELPDAAFEKNNKLQGKSASALLHKKLIMNSVTILMDAVNKSGSKALAEEAAAYIELTLYKLFRYLYTAGRNNEAIFTIEANEAHIIADAEYKQSEAVIRAILCGKPFKGMENENVDATLLRLSQSAIKLDYPAYSQSLNALLLAVGKKIEKRIL